MLSWNRLNASSFVRWVAATVDAIAIADRPAKLL